MNLELYRLTQIPNIGWAVATHLNGQPIVHQYQEGTGIELVCNKNLSISCVMLITDPITQHDRWVPVNYYDVWQTNDGQYWVDHPPVTEVQALKSIIHDNGEIIYAYQNIDLDLMKQQGDVTVANMISQVLELVADITDIIDHDTVDDD